MISVLMSEGLAPSNGAKSHEPPREASRPSKDEKFSSFLDSQDERSDVDPKQENETAGAISGGSPSNHSAPDSDRSTVTEKGPRAPETESGRIAAETTVATSLLTSTETEAIADTAASSSEEIIVPKATNAETDGHTVVDGVRATEIENTRATRIDAPHATDTETAADSSKVQSNHDADADAVTRPSNADSDIAPRKSDIEPRLAATSDKGTDAKPDMHDTRDMREASNLNVAPKIDDSSVRVVSDAPAEAALNLTDTPEQASEDGQARQVLAANDPIAALASDEVASADKISAHELRTGDLADLSARKQTTSLIVDEKVVPVNIAREAAPLTSESLLAVAPTTTPSTAASVSTGGLAPTVPTHVIAAPNELTSVVMNALKNGGDVQEQLVVQLDPPELGRVLIDFKFDAQGLQQITVTSENPEALKRLRELHFELTEALREQGFSDSNLSFQQEAQDQSRSNWQAPEWGRAQSQVVAAAERSSSESAMPTPPNFTGRDRLDLLL